MIKIFESDFDTAEEKAVNDVIKSGWLTNGDMTISFENHLRDIILDNTTHVAAVSSCTAALHIALMASDIKKGDEVIVPALNFVSDFNVIKAVGAKPVLVDVESVDVWSPSLENIKRAVTKKTKACIIVHFAGIPAKNIFEIADYCKQRNIVLIEDVAHAAGATINDIKCGSIGDFGAFSFYSNKNISTGEGGCISTKQEIKKIKELRSHGMTASTLDREKGRVFSYDVSNVGLNYRIDEIRSAIGIEQLKKFDWKHKIRKELVLAYLDNLPNNISTPFENVIGNSSIITVDHIFPILLPHKKNRLEVIENLKQNKVQTTMHYPAPWGFSAYKNEFSSKSLNITREITERELTLPLHTRMSISDVRYICKCLGELL